MAAPKLGIVAGGGALPARLIEICRNTGREFFVLALKGQTPPETVDDAPHEWIRLGEGGRGIRLMHRESVEEIVFAGPVRRPGLAELRPDLRTARFFARLGRAWIGDDSLLSALVAEMEKEGFRVVGADSLLGESHAPEGPLGRHAPDEAATRDIERGLEAVARLGALDIGQAVVVQQGIVLGVEAAEGTDALIRRCGPLQRRGPGGILVKACKPGQDRRVDLPAIGPETVRLAAECGLRGLAVESGNALIVDRDALVEAADAGGLFVVGVRLPQ